MTRTRLISFSNLTCRYGDRYVLLDLAKELLLPAVFGGHTRSYGRTRYFFNAVGSAAIPAAGFADDQVVIYGRLIKDTVLTRDQVYEAGVGLIADQESIQSSPSSLFVLDLNNHKLIFSPEVPHAPTVENFSATLQAFLGRERDRYVRSLLAESSLTEEPKSLSFFYEDVPPPQVEATPMASTGSVTEFIEQFAKITSLTIKLVDTNAEFPRGETFKRLREMKDEASAKTTSLTLESQAGLRKLAVIAEVGAAAAGGNQKVQIRGVDEDGAKLVGNNQHVKFQIQATDLSDSTPLAAEQMVRAFGEQVAKGRLNPDIGTVDAEKLAAVREALSI